MAGTKQHQDPQTDDPLAEPTIGRRMWSARIRAGYTRKSWARAIKRSLTAVFNLEIGHTTMPDLETLLRACELVKYTPDQMIYGRTPPPFAAARESLTAEQISVIWHDARAPFEAMTALYELTHGPGGEYLLITRAFVETYLAAFTAVFVRDDESTYADAKVQARIAATQGAALASAVALGAMPVGTPGKRKRKVKRVTHRR